MTDFMRDELGAPYIVDRSTFQADKAGRFRIRKIRHIQQDVMCILDEPDFFNGA